MDRDRTIQGLEIILYGCDGIQCENCCFHIKEPATPARCGLPEEQIQEEALELLKEQQEQIDRLIEENASNAEMAEGLKELLKEQETEIRQLRLALEIAKGTCNGIKSGGGQFADMQTMQSATQKKGL